MKNTGDKYCHILRVASMLKTKIDTCVISIIYTVAPMLFALTTSRNDKRVNIFYIGDTCTHVQKVSCNIFLNILH